MLTAPTFAAAANEPADVGDNFVEITPLASTLFGPGGAPLAGESFTGGMLSVSLN